MKKFLSAVLAAALMLGCTFAVNAEVVPADEKAPQIGADEVAVWADDFTAEVGDVVDVTMWYKADQGFSAFNFGFTYDTDKLKLVEHYSETDDDDVLVESANSEWYDMNGKPTKPAQWIFPQISQDNQDNLKKSSAEVAALSVPYHYAWGLSDAARNWGSTDGEEKLMLAKVSFEVKEGASGVAVVAPCFYAAAPKYIDGGVKAYTLVSDDSFNCKITIAGGEPVAAITNTEVKYGHYTSNGAEGEVTKYGAAAEFALDTATYTADSVKKIGFYYITADAQAVPTIEAADVAAVFTAGGKFFVSVSNLELGTTLPLKAYIILNDDSVVMSDVVEIKPTADNTAALDVTYKAD